MDIQTFSAPWSRLLKATSAFTTAICIGFPLFASHWMLVARTPEGVHLMLDAIAPIGIPLAALFVIRGYAVTADSILVKRLLWSTRLPRAGLKSASFSPEALAGSLRTCGNGGFYSFTGWYQNRELGPYRAFMTDRDRAVVLRWEGRTVVVSPGDPEGFVRAVNEIL
jgi:hypothetical protein